MENNKKQKLFSALWNLTTTESLHTEEITVDTRLYIVHKNCLIQYHINRIFSDASCPPFEPFKCRGETKCISIQVTFREECSKQWLTQLRFAAISKHIYTHIYISSVPVWRGGGLLWRLWRGPEAVHGSQEASGGRNFIVYLLASLDSRVIETLQRLRLIYLSTSNIKH